MSGTSFVKQNIDSNKVIVFSKSYCPYSLKAKKALESILDRSKFAVVELDQRDDGNEIQDALLEISGIRTVPQVFIDGKFFGDSSAIETALGNGKLEKAVE